MSADPTPERRRDAAGDSAERDSIELDRLRRLEALDELLPTLATVLDVRTVFVRISEIAKHVVAHDALGLLRFTDDLLYAIPYAVTGSGLIELPDRIKLPDPEYIKTIKTFDIIADMQTRDFERDLPPVKLGYRASLRVPIFVKGKLVAGMNFMSFTPNLYTPADGMVARRIGDYIALALSHQQLAEEAERAAEARERAARLEARVRALTDQLTSMSGYHRVIGESRAWRDTLTQATQVAATDTTVLLQGESGTGKEVVARYIHRASPRHDGPFIALNCAALPEQLLESELFGYERGAFTGATQSKPGQIELAAGGTLFLDEVAEMSPSAQAKFLRVLQEREFQRLGSTRARRADVRVIAATNQDLRLALERGTFREDLYYRLHVFGIALPALRDRRDDILPLSEAFLQELGRAFGRPPAGISREACDVLMDYAWPGNVRELRNMLERAAILCEGGLILAEHLAIQARPAAQSEPRRAMAAAADAPATPEAAAAANGAPAGAFVGSGDLKTVERGLIERALQEARFNKSKAARTLGLTRTQLYVRMRRHGLE
jgi:transcriptional regulator with GAF, ATPase, and Fis domain